MRCRWALAFVANCHQRRCWKNCIHVTPCKSKTIKRIVPWNCWWSKSLLKFHGSFRFKTIQYDTVVDFDFQGTLHPLCFPLSTKNRGQGSLIRGSVKGQGWASCNPFTTWILFFVGVIFVSRIRCHGSKPRWNSPPFGGEYFLELVPANPSN